MRITLGLTIALLAVYGSACAQDDQRPRTSEAVAQPAATEQQQSAAIVPQKSPTPSPVAFPGSATRITDGLEHPWGIAFLPGGRMLVTERPGRLRIVHPNGAMSAPLAGVPDVQARSQGGLLDVAVDPRFEQNQTIYLTFSEPGDDGTAGTSLAKARLGDGRLENVQVIYRQQPKVKGGGHFGSRIVFRNDGTIFVTQGDRQSYSEQAQDLASGIGKVVRINPDGSIPKDNPFVGRDGVRPEIWSYGHRNIQSASLDAEGRLWTVEHGPRGGDEMHMPEAGKNYGWPVITYGVEYSGGKVGKGETEREGMEQPVYYWDPVIAPSGMVRYTGNRYPGWTGSYFVGSLTPGGLVRLTLANGRVSEERYLEELGRVRDVEQGPDGLLYLITDQKNGRLLRLDPR
ncbi:MAG TPA: PQQ-dependent sugar dehydrogenase [Thermoanaerobaculia bacterium]